MIVEWLPRAVEQLLSIIDYVSEDSPAAAVELGQSIREKTTTLTTYPNRYRTGRVKGTREMVVMPNYIIVYRIAGERVQILRVRHARQRR
jgi:toxin ParE1/3/4